MYLIKDTLGIQVLLEKMSEYTKLKGWLENERDNYHGHSFDYFYRSDINKLEKLSSEIEDTITETFKGILEPIVEKAVRKILGKEEE